MQDGPRLLLPSAPSIEHVRMRDNNCSRYGRPSCRPNVSSPFDPKCGRARHREFSPALPIVIHGEFPALQREVLVFESKLTPSQARRPQVRITTIKTIDPRIRETETLASPTSLSYALSHTRHSTSSCWWGKIDRIHCPTRHLRVVFGR